MQMYHGAYSPLPPALKYRSRRTGKNGKNIKIKVGKFKKIEQKRKGRKKKTLTIGKRREANEQRQSFGLKLCILVLEGGG
jgi:hypothetical protein